MELLSLISDRSPRPGTCRCGEAQSAHLVRAVGQVAHGGGQAALRGQQAGVVGELLRQDGALHGHLPVPQALDGLPQDHHLLHQILGQQREANRGTKKQITLVFLELNG